MKDARREAQEDALFDDVETATLFVPKTSVVTDVVFARVELCETNWCPLLGEASTREVVDVGVEFVELSLRETTF